MLGGFLLLGALAPAAAIVIIGLGLNVNAYKPHWWLAGDARGDDAARADAAMQELTHRLRAGRMSLDHAQQIVELALTRHADPAADWTPAWSSYLEVARSAELLLPEQLLEYIQRIVRIGFEPAGRQAHGAPHLVMIRVNAHRGPPTNWLVSLWANLTHINDTPVADPSERIVAVTLGSAMIADSYAHPALLDLEPGVHQITIRARIAVGDGPVRPKDAVANWARDFQLNVTVAPPDEPAALPEIELVSDESLRQQMARAMRVSNLRIEGAGDDAGYAGTGSLVAEFPPVDGAFTVHWRFVDAAASREAHVGQSFFRQGKLSGGMFGRRLAIDFAEAIPPHVDVILRPSITAAATDPSLQRIWGEEIVIRNVAVRRRQTADEDPER